jgi:hypothetical protein
MTRHIDKIFNPARPLFVKTPVQSAGKVWDRGERYNWEFLQIPLDKVQAMFIGGWVHHNPELEEEVVKKVTIGDGLEELDLDQLHVLVGNINAKVKDKTKNNSEFLAKKCPTSRLKDKQIALIRRWRTAYGDME